MSVSVIWKATETHTETVLVDGCETILSGEWANCEDNAESAVQECCEDYFRGSEYADLEDISVTVTDPASISGLYEVSLRRIVKATVIKM